MTSLFIDVNLARKIEATEANLARDVVANVQARRSSAHSFSLDVGEGVASYVRPGSPMNKIIGFGIIEVPDEFLLADVEAAYRKVNEAVRFEISTFTRPETTLLLTKNGYRLAGFENLLVVDFSDYRPTPSEKWNVKRISRDEISVWKTVMVEASSVADETGLVVDSFSKEVIASALNDLLVERDLRYLANSNDRLVGGASMCIEKDIAFFIGAATLPEFRKQGVQGALLRCRLNDAKRLGAKLGVITTGIGTRSQANVMRQGFSLAYSRAILIKNP